MRQYLVITSWKLIQSPRITQCCIVVKLKISISAVKYLGWQKWYLCGEYIHSKIHNKKLNKKIKNYRITSTICSAFFWFHLFFLLLLLVLSILVILALQVFSILWYSTTTLHLCCCRYGQLTTLELLQKLHLNLRSDFIA